MSIVNVIMALALAYFCGKLAALAIIDRDWWSGASAIVLAGLAVLNLAVAVA